MSLQITISDAVKVAMRAKDSARLTTLRFLQAAIKQREIDDRKALNDTEVMAIIEKQIKQRRESIAAYEKAGRAETAAQESAEIVVLQEFLPQAASEQEVLAVIEAAIEEARASGAQGPAVMGKVMATVKQALAGRAEMAAVSQQVKAKLS
uniref:GatB/YqeY domain-containing protein n=1 Tax=Orrella sp. TaxID=1921583 RepID=UPI00404859F4